MVKKVNADLEKGRGGFWGELLGSEVRVRVWLFGGLGLYWVIMGDMNKLLK